MQVCQLYARKQGKPTRDTKGDAGVVCVSVRAREVERGEERKRERAEKEEDVEYCIWNMKSVRSRASREYDSK